ncbi:MAG: preprotein translocase subunit SecG [Waddliaceae bacterium]|jgi:preprotein translocase subunit SecG|nr:preprotein translocase subunit SecG [Waddliaceae bacterium]MBT3578605.1 preprotein translocase subunit SecG [Waddliaceae bacterium]MBT4445531.1 preprotein translocase subunit SecG [Waddliaceae bacterium]MBT6928408.1 preprotein translocase subunit SecG [Waddliaceae bacterium]MBT7265094.1 preprotein translocase subunit SecG [Waddliaceae bacterium]
MSFIYYFAIITFIVVALLLCLVVLIQESKSSGLGATFGGGDSSSMFGASTADVLTKFTAWLATIFMVSCVVLSFWTGSLGRAKTKAASNEYIQQQTEQAEL